MKIEQCQLQNMLITAAELGAKRALIDVGMLKPYLKKAAAYRIYGKRTVERWITEGLIKPVQDGTGATVRLDRMQLEVVAKASNRTTYLPTDQLTAPKALTPVPKVKVVKKSKYQLGFEQECDRVFDSLKKKFADKLAIIEAVEPGYTEQLKKQLFQPIDDSKTEARPERVRALADHLGEKWNKKNAAKSEAEADRLISKMKLSKQ